jgi:two-component system OmpR family response regulator
MRILIVEDDLQLASSLLLGLEEAGMAADAVKDGAEALAVATTTAYDVIVLDVMLPDRDGFQVCRGLRQRRVETPILMLTGRDAIEDRVQGLNSGADDYLTKPFALRELVARIKALSRRHLVDRTATLSVGPISLDTVSHVVQVSGQPVELTAKEFAIMEFFMLHPRQVLSREQVLENVWDYAFDGGRNLIEVYMGRLRKKLTDAGIEDPFVTLRGAGYRLDPA